MDNKINRVSRKNNTTATKHQQQQQRGASLCFFLLGAGWWWFARLLCSLIDVGGSAVLSCFLFLKAQQVRPEKALCCLSSSLSFLPDCSTVAH